MISHRLLPAAAVFLATSLSFAAAETTVVASIKPVHSLVAGVMQGVGTPALLVQGGASPHSYSLKPSQASAIENADLIFWVGNQIETFLEKSVNSIGANARSVELIDTPSLVRLEIRDDGDFESHDHDDGGKHGSGHEDNDHDDHADDKDQAGHDHHVNAHIWLDPANARAMVVRIRDELAKVDPANAETYAANARNMASRLEALENGVQATLAPVIDKNFVVFHDAYHYFENRFGLSAKGSITISPEILPGAERIAEIQSKIRRLGSVCVFSEPQFEPRIVSVVTEGTKARSATLDPLGAEFPDGPDLYFELILNLANSLKGCLSGNS